MLKQDWDLFQKANDVIRRLTAPGPDDKPVNLVSPTTGGEDLNTLAMVINRMGSCAEKLEQANAVVAYYARKELYTTLRSDMMIAEDQGAKARTYLDTLAD